MQTNFFLLFSFGMQHLCRKVSRKWMEFWEIGPEREGASSIWYVLWSSMRGSLRVHPGVGLFWFTESNCGLVRHGRRGLVRQCLLPMGIKDECMGGTGGRWGGRGDGRSTAGVGLPSEQASLSGFPYFHFLSCLS